MSPDFIGRVSRLVGINEEIEVRNKLIEVPSKGVSNYAFRSNGCGEDCQV